jgi:hypothetical protein
MSKPVVLRSIAHHKLASACTDSPSHLGQRHQCSRQHSLAGGHHFFNGILRPDVAKENLFRDQLTSRPDL